MPLRNNFYTFKFYLKTLNFNHKIKIKEYFLNYYNISIVLKKYRNFFFTMSKYLVFKYSFYFIKLFILGFYLF